MRFILTQGAWDDKPPNFTLTHTVDNHRRKLQLNRSRATREKRQVLTQGDPGPNLESLPHSQDEK